MSKEHNPLDLNTVEINTEIVAADVVTLDDLSLALIGGGDFVVAL